jgi:hypothetical protein
MQAQATAASSDGKQLIKVKLNKAVLLSPCRQQGGIAATYS